MPLLTAIRDVARQAHHFVRDAAGIFVLLTVPDSLRARPAHEPLSDRMLAVPVPDARDSRSAAA